MDLINKWLLSEGDWRVGLHLYSEMINWAIARAVIASIAFTVLSIIFRRIMNRVDERLHLAIRVAWFIWLSFTVYLVALAIQAKWFPRSYLYDVLLGGAS
jgi:hypothetical protein